MWIDCAKGIGILLVILGHTYGIPALLKSWIYSFHMPLFFILSGLTISMATDKTTGETVKKYAKTYLLPYFCLCGLNLILECVRLWLFGQLTIARFGKFVVGILYAYANMEWMPNCSPLWFLPCLFLAKCTFHIIMRNASERKQIAYSAACCGISYLWYDLGLPRLPWNGATVPMAVFFLWVGHEIRKHDLMKRLYCKTGRTLWILLVFLMTPMLIHNGSLVGMNENTYGNLLLFLIGSLGYSVMMLAAAQRFSSCFMLTDFFGKNTIVIIGFNYFALYLSTEIYYLIPFIRNCPIHWITSFLLTTILLSGMIVLRKSIHNTIANKRK